MCIQIAKLFLFRDQSQVEWDDLHQQNPSTDDHYKNYTIFHNNRKSLRFQGEKKKIRKNLKIQDAVREHAPK